MSLDVFGVAYALVGVALVLALARAARGPSLPDRVVALELTSMLSIAILLVRAVDSASGYLLDVAIVMALVGFLGTVSFAYYLERRPPE